MNLKHTLLIASVIALSACASKVRLDDLPNVNSGAGSTLSRGTNNAFPLGSAPSGMNDASLSGSNAGGFNGAGNSGGGNASSMGVGGVGGVGGTGGAAGVSVAGGAGGVGSMGSAGNSGVGAGGSGSSGMGAGVATVQAGSDGAQINAGLLSKRSVYFDYDSFLIREEARSVLQAHAKLIAGKRGVKIALEGHTDERGGGEYNLALGQKRANAVLEALQLMGVLSTQMEAVSFGKEKPKSLGSDEAGYAENRRVDIQYR